MQYICVNCSSDICAVVQLIVLGSEKTTNQQFVSLKRSIEHLKRGSAQELIFVKLGMSSMRVVVISEACFANAPGLKSQLGYVISIADKERSANIVHYGSSRCHRVTRSAIAAKSTY